MVVGGFSCAFVECMRGEMLGIEIRMTMRWGVDLARTEEALLWRMLA